MDERYLRATIYRAIQHRPASVGIDVQGFDYDRSQHSNGTTLVVKDVTADDLRELAAQLLEQANLMEDTLRAALQSLLQATGDRPYVRQDGVHYTRYGKDVINFDRREDGSLTRIDVDWVRAVVADLGYDIMGEWLPRQGVSWLSDGVSAGVSFRITKRTGS